VVEDNSMTPRHVRVGDLVLSDASAHLSMPDDDSELGVVTDSDPVRVFWIGNMSYGLAPGVSGLFSNFRREIFVLSGSAFAEVVVSSRNGERSGR
jgi:hypothetical protein